MRPFQYYNIVKDKCITMQLMIIYFKIASSITLVMVRSVLWIKHIDVLLNTINCIHTILTQIIQVKHIYNDQIKKL